jgi:hypothetical protein
MCKKLLKNTKELALLHSITPALENCIVVCVIYRRKGRIWMKQFQDQNCTSAHWKMFLTCQEEGIHASLEISKFELIILLHQFTCFMNLVVELFHGMFTWPCEIRLEKMLVQPPPLGICLRVSRCDT